MTTKMYLVEQREDWKPGDCYVCKFTCKAAFNLNPACPMKGAKEAVEVAPHDEAYYHPGRGWRVNGKPVRVFAVEDK